MSLWQTTALLRDPYCARKMEKKENKTRPVVVVSSACGFRSPQVELNQAGKASSNRTITNIRNQTIYSENGPI